MEKETLKRIFEFLEEKEEHKAPFIWKLENNIPLTEEELNVKGDLDLRFSSITSLPEGLEVGDDLYLHYSKITSLPDDLQVGGELNIIGCDAITSLPKGLEVGKILYIKYTPLTKYSDEELREMIKPGFIKGEIVR